MVNRVPEVTGYGELVEVGRGGFAVVYRAHHEKLDRDVALKVMANANLDETSQHRFERECRAMGQLSWHPHIVPVFDAGATVEGWPYLAMAYLPQGSLGDRVVSAGPFPWPDVLRVGIQIAGALQVAHDAGMLHRDLKPENVLVDQLGDSRLSDFGIAALADQSVQTNSGQILGSVLHAAPEVLRGERASQVSDVYSLGSTLYELLAGSPAFFDPSDESIVAVILRATSESAPALTVPGLPGEVADLVRRAMDKDRSLRPASARAMGEALQDVQRHHGLPVTPLRLPRDPAPDSDSTLPGRSRRRGTLVVDALEGEPTSTRDGGVEAERRRLVVVDADPDEPAEPARAPVALDLPFAPVVDLPHAPVVAGYVTSEPEPRSQGRGWMWFAVVASMLAVAVTTMAIVIALSR